MAYRAAVFGRLQISDDTRTLGAFSVEKDTYTYFILAELQINKWVPFWSAKTENLSDDYLEILRNLTNNIYNFFSGTPAEENVNDEAADITAQL